MKINFILLLLLFSIPTFSSATESLLQCLHRHSVSDAIISYPETSSFNTLFNITTLNQRILAAKTQKPFLILSPAAESDIQKAVICTRNLNIRIRVRSGGHDYEGLSHVSYADRFVLLDLANLRSISVNTSANTAWVQSGATIGELYYAIAQKAGPHYAFPAGSCPTVGVGGHFGGGGIGTLVRKYGLSADRIIDARIVNVYGEVMDRKSMGEDLFWAIRGGDAGSFGIVASYQVKLVRVPSVVTVYRVVRTDPSKLVTQWQNVAPTIDNRLLIRIIVTAVNKTVSAVFESLFLGPKTELLELMEAHFAQLGVIESDFQEMSWVNSTLFFSGYVNNGKDLTSLLDRRKYLNFGSSKTKSDFVTDPIPENVWDAIFKKWFVNEKANLILLIEPMGGRNDKISNTSIPFPHRKGNLYGIQYMQIWSDRSEAVAKENVETIRKLYEFMTPYVSKNPRMGYCNYRDLDLGKNVEGESDFSKARNWGDKYFGVNNFRRLGCVKAKVDPENYFRNEQSVPPLVSFA